MPGHAKDCRTAPERAGEEFDELIRKSEERAAQERETHTYPYDLEEGQ